MPQATQSNTAYLCARKAGFDKQRLFSTQGDCGWWQCFRPCHQKTYDNEIIIKRMVDEQKDQTIPSKLIFLYQVSMNLRADDTFMEDKGWHTAAWCYEEILRSHEREHVLFLELDVSGHTPGAIKYHF